MDRREPNLTVPARIIEDGTGRVGIEPEPGDGHDAIDSSDDGTDFIAALLDSGARTQRPEEEIILPVRRYDLRQHIAMVLEHDYGKKKVNTLADPLGHLLLSHVGDDVSLATLLVDEQRSTFEALSLFLVQQAAKKIGFSGLLPEQRDLNTYLHTIGTQFSQRLERLLEVPLPTVPGATNISDQDIWKVKKKEIAALRQVGERRYSTESLLAAQMFLPLVQNHERRVQEARSAGEIETLAALHLIQLTIPEARWTIPEQCSLEYAVYRTFAAVARNSRAFTTVDSDALALHYGHICHSPTIYAQYIAREGKRLQAALATQNVDQFWNAIMEDIGKKFHVYVPSIPQIQSIREHEKVVAQLQRGVIPLLEVVEEDLRIYTQKTRDTQRDLEALTREKEVALRSVDVEYEPFGAALATHVSQSLRIRLPQKKVTSKRNFTNYRKQLEDFLSKEFRQVAAIPAHTGALEIGNKVQIARTFHDDGKFYHGGDVQSMPLGREGVLEKIASEADYILSVPADKGKDSTRWHVHPQEIERPGAAVRRIIAEYATIQDAVAGVLTEAEQALKPRFLEQAVRRIEQEHNDRQSAIQATLNTFYGKRFGVDDYVIATSPKGTNGAYSTGLSSSVLPPGTIGRIVQYKTDGKWRVIFFENFSAELHHDEIAATKEVKSSSRDKMKPSIESIITQVQGSYYHNRATLRNVVEDAAALFPIMGVDARCLRVFLHEHIDVREFIDLKLLPPGSIFDEIIAAGKAIDYTAMATTLLDKIQQKDIVIIRRMKKVDTRRTSDAQQYAQFRDQLPHDVIVHGYSTASVEGKALQKGDEVMTIGEIGYDFPVGVVGKYRIDCNQDAKNKVHLDILGREDGCTERRLITPIHKLYDITVIPGEEKFVTGARVRIRQDSEYREKSKVAGTLEQDLEDITSQYAHVSFDDGYRHQYEKKDLELIDPLESMDATTKVEYLAKVERAREETRMWLPPLIAEVEQEFENRINTFAYRASFVAGMLQLLGMHTERVYQLFSENVAHLSVLQERGIITAPTTP